MHSPRKNLTLPCPPNGSQILNPCNHTCKCYNPKPRRNPKSQLNSLTALNLYPSSLCRRNSNREPRPTDQNGGGRRDLRDLPATHTTLALGASIGHAIGSTRCPAVGNPCRQQESDANCDESVGCGGGMAGEEMEVKRRPWDGGSNGHLCGWPSNGSVQRSLGCSAARPAVGCMEDSNFSVPGPGGKPLGLARPVPARAPALYSTQMPKLCF